MCSVEALPLTRSGKVDRQALEAWWAQRRTAFRAPITKQQQRVVEAHHLRLEICSEILK